MYSLLDGIRILDLTTVVLGPMATALLGDLGADVIKVEPPGGDLFRATSPSRNAGMGAPFMGVNRNKRPIVLDLKSDGVSEVVERLVADADVFVHNMRPAAVQRLGIGADRLRARNSRLIYCSAVGYGSDGPYRDKPAYDDVVQGQMGLASLLADSDGAPRLAPTIIADKVTEVYCMSGTTTPSASNRAISLPPLDSVSKRYDRVFSFSRGRWLRRSRRRGSLPSRGGRWLPKADGRGAPSLTFRQHANTSPHRKSVTDHDDRLFDVLADDAVPDPENKKPMAFQIAIPLVVDAVGVLRSVKLDDQLTLMANKADDIRPNRSLSSKFHTKLAAFDLHPQIDLRCRHLTPQLTGSPCL